MCGVQLQDQRLVRFESEQRHILEAAAELCHGQNEYTNPQQAVEEREPSEPSALTFGSKCFIQSTSTQAPDRRAGEDKFVLAIAETGNHCSQILVTGRLKPTLYY